MSDQINSTSPYPTLSVDNLSVVLDGHTIVDKVSFTVPAGQTTAIIGPNGAGKSVLIKSLLGLLPIHSGTVHFFGQPLAKYTSIAHRLSYIPQSITFDTSFPITVQELFWLKSPSPFGLPAPDQTRMHELLKLVGMQQYSHARLHTLSGGQTQRVFVAYSLFNKPELLILDEPSAGIDTAGQESIYALLERIQDQEQLALLLVSHELDIVMRYANQVLCLNRQLLCAGVPHEVLSNELLTKMYGAPMGHFHHDHQSKSDKPISQ